MKREIEELDKADFAGNEEIETERKESLESMRQEEKQMEVIFEKYNLEKMILINDMERLEACLRGDKRAAEKIAHANYEQNRTKKKIKNCEAEMCILFYVDEKYGYALDM